jgi:DNA sulfur modification protein DndC
MAFDYKATIKEIQDQFLEEDNHRPWIIAFSGGKDSTTLLQCVWNAIKDLNPVDQKRRRVYVICNNTLVENPAVLSYVDDQLKLVEKAAIEQGLPITVHQTTPKLEDTFWVRLIGKGYPAPNNLLRWCTERLKINPTTNFIKERINEHGEALILIGTRSEESGNRAKSVKKHEVKGSKLRNHPLPNAQAYAPIEDMTTDEVWQFLLQVKSPYGSSNRELIAMYNNASDGDCPLVMDINTPSCGNSRFGCWVCTVVNRDKSMEAMIDKGEDWMIPLMEIRDFLAKTIDRTNPELKEDPYKYRMEIRRNGEPGLGPYKPMWRKYILEFVLNAQKKIQSENPDLQLISYQELAAIQVTWNRDFIFEYNVSEIYNHVFGRNIEFNEVGENIKQEKQLLKSNTENESDYNLINKLLKAQKNKILLTNRWGLQNDLDNLLEEEIYPTYTHVYQKNSPEQLSDLQG